jgi:hypothetical protein
MSKCVFCRPESIYNFLIPNISDILESDYAKHVSDCKTCNNNLSEMFVNNAPNELEAFFYENDIFNLSSLEFNETFISGEEDSILQSSPLLYNSYMDRKFYEDQYENITNLYISLQFTRTVFYTDLLKELYDYLHPISGESVYSFEAYMIADEDLITGQLRLLEADTHLILPTNTHIRVLITADDVLHS